MTKKDQNKRKKMIVTASIKGGVGKSNVMSKMAQIARKRGIKLAGYDADAKNSGFFEQCGVGESSDPFQSILTFDLRKDNERGMLLDSVDSGAELILIDTPADSLSDLQKIVDEGQGVNKLVSEISQAGYDLNFLHLISEDAPTVASVSDYLDTFEAHPEVKHIAILNHKNPLPEGISDEEYFMWWYGFQIENEQFGGKTRTRFLNAGNPEFQFPNLPFGPKTKMEVRGAKIYDVIGIQPKMSFLTRTERTRVSNFVEKAEVFFDKVMEAI